MTSFFRLSAFPPAASAPSSDDEYNTDDEEAEDPTPPFLPLEEQNNSNNNNNHNEYLVHRTASPPPVAPSSGKKISSPPSPGGLAAAVAKGTKVAHHHHHSKGAALKNLTTCQLRISGKQFVSLLMFSILALVIYDALFREPEDRWLKPEDSSVLLEWVQRNPTRGWILIVLVIAIAVVLMIPIGTPLTLGCGYIYKGAYGWKVGVTIATIVSMGGSALGAVVCFLLGRYLMRDQVRKWIRKYPLFDAIDVAAAEHGLRIMAMLYLTPILPLGPVSYMCGTTSMALSSFVMAKVASLPLMLLYVFIGASMGALVGGSDPKAADELKSIEDNEVLIVSGIVLSFVMIAGITSYIRKELNKILERQQKAKPGELEPLPPGKDGFESTDETNVELGHMTRRRVQ